MKQVRHIIVNRVATRRSPAAGALSPAAGTGRAREPPQFRAVAAAGPPCANAPPPSRPIVPSTTRAYRITIHQLYSAQNIFAIF